MEELKFECDAMGCAEIIKTEGGLCSHHLRRYLESKKPGAPVFMRKSQNGGGPKKAPLDPSTGSGTASLKRGKILAAELKCSECGITAAEAFKTQKKYFSRKKGRCRECLEKEKPLKGKSKAEKPLTPASPVKGRGKKETKGKRGKKTKRPKSQIPPSRDF